MYRGDTTELKKINKMRKEKENKKGRKMLYVQGESKGDPCNDRITYIMGCYYGYYVS